MIITNLIELINAKVLNETSLYKVSGFSVELSELEYANAFFTDDEEVANEAARLGAYVIISSKDLNISDKDLAYLKVDDLEKAIIRLINFECQNKEIYLLDSIDYEFLKRLDIALLSGNLFRDFSLYFKSDFLFATSLPERIKLNAKNYLADYEIIKSSSFFYHDLILNNECFMNIFAPKIFVKSLALAHLLGFNLYNLKLLDCVFFDEENNITKLSEASKLVFFETEELIINELKKHLKILEISSMKNEKYMLYKGDKQDFLDSLIQEEKGLF